MARYDVAPAWFHTPRGRGALVYVREGTNDYNTAYSCLDEDEYGTRDLDLAGTVMDVGGYLGTASLAILLDHPDTRAIIVEPLGENRALIEANLQANGVRDRAEVVANAVGDGPVDIHYAFTDTESGLHHAFVGNAVLAQPEGDHQIAHVSGITYSELAPDGVTFLKIDCEGGEWPFFADPATRRIPRIHGEVHSVDGHRPRDLEALLPDHDITYSFPPGVDPDPDAQVTCGFVAIRR